MFKLTLLLATVTLGFAQEKATGIESEKNITNLDLSNRSITSLEDYNFSKLIELESVDLSYNDISYIGDDQFRNNRKLKSINLAGNPHLKLHQFSTFFISNIENLNLSHCAIEAIYENSFDGLLNIRSIDLSYNPMVKDGINFFALKPLLKLKEITVSQTDGPLFESICQEIDITIMIRSESKNIDIKCEELRKGNLEAILNPETKKEVEIEKVTVPIVIEVITEAPIPSIADEHEIVEKAKEENTTQDNQKVEENITLPPPIIPADKTETEPKKDENTSKTGELNPPQIPIEEKQKNESETIIKNEVTKTEIEAPPNEVAKNNNKNSKAEDGSEKVAKTMLGQEINKDGEAKAVQPSESSSPAAGTTVLVILVIAAVVGGLAAFGYKYYKSSKEDEDEPMEKELQEITVDSKTNGAAMRVENEPLIHQRKNSVEIKEVDETNEDQNKNKSSQNGSSYIPITTVEKMIDEETDNNQASK